MIKLPNERQFILTIINKDSEGFSSYMNDNDLTKAILNLLKKELGSVGNILPAELLSGIRKKISPEIEEIIEKSGYVTKSKYNSLEKLAQELEKRIAELEKNL